MNPEQFYVYILTNLNRTVLYTGVTNNLQKRLMEHWMQRHSTKTFTGRYNCHFLVHYEAFENAMHAIDREKEIKGWAREKKMHLIITSNPKLKFLNDLLFDVWPPEGSG